MGMDIAIEVACLRIHADEVELIMKERDFKLISHGTGTGRIKLCSVGPRPSWGAPGFVAAIETQLRDRCKDPIVVTEVDACENKVGQAEGNDK